MEILFSEGKELLEIDGKVMNLKKLLLEYNKNKRGNLDLRDNEIDYYKPGEYIFVSIRGEYDGILLVIKETIQEMMDLFESSIVCYSENGFIIINKADVGTIEVFNILTNKTYSVDLSDLNFSDDEDEDKEEQFEDFLDFTENWELEIRETDFVMKGSNKQITISFVYKNISPIV